MGRVLLVAEAPTVRSDPSRPLRCDSGRRLAKIAGVDLERLLAPFDVVNLVEHYSRAWPRDEALEGAEVLRSLAIEEGRSVVLLGRKVADAFGLVGPPPFRWIERDGFRYAYSPHPSGKSRWWNDVRNVERAKKFWRALHRSASREQAEGIAPERSRRRGHASHRGETQRPDAELAWLRDRVESAYVESVSMSASARALVKIHAVVIEKREEIEHEGIRFLPQRCVSRTQAYNLLRDVFDRWKEKCSERVEDLRRAHHESVAARIAQAKAAGAWSTVARLHELLAQIDGVVGRPDERAASLQVSMHGSGGDVATASVVVGGVDLTALSDDDLIERARAALPPGKLVVDAEAEPEPADP